MSALAQSARTAKMTPAEAYCYDSGSESEIDETTPEFLRLYDEFLSWMSAKAPVSFSHGERASREFRRHVWRSDEARFESVRANDPLVYSAVLLKWNREAEARK